MGLIKEQTEMSIRQVSRNLRALNVPSPGAAIAHSQMSTTDCKDCTTSSSSRQTRMKNKLWQQHRHDAAVAGSSAKPPRPTARPLD
jgi:ribosomal protein L37AE/L43A